MYTLQYKQGPTFERNGRDGSGSWVLMDSNGLTVEEFTDHDIGVLDIIMTVCGKYDVKGVVVVPDTLEYTE